MIVATDNSMKKKSSVVASELPMSRYALAILVHAALIAFWYLVVRYGKIPPFILPGPIETISTLNGSNYHWINNALVTATEIFGGYILAITIGVGLATVLSWSNIATLVVMPLLVTLNMVPKVALGPLFIVWLSYGILSNAVIAFSISFFPILLNASRGFHEVEPDLLELVRTLRSSKWQTFTKIKLPSALPFIFSGMKIGAILAVAGAIVGEFLGSSRGLGYLMVQVQSTLDTAAMFMAVILITLIGVMLYAIVLGIERWVIVRDARLE
jgi:NitT/TauT family transport system permease protein